MSHEQSAAPDPEADPALSPYREGLEAVEPEVDGDGLYREVEGRIGQAGRQPAWWLRSRSTAVRRAIAVLAFAVLASFGVLAVPRPDMGVYPMARMVLTLGALGLMLVVSLHQALRPLHVPALPRRRAWLLVGAALLATLVLTALPPAHHAHPTSLGGTGDELASRAASCVYFGLLIGLPVFALARLLDRGSVLSALLAACASGLTANFVLQLHCPITATEHTVVAHFGVAVVFVVGVALLDWLVGRRRR